MVDTPRVEHRFLAKIGAFPPDAARWSAKVRLVDAPGLKADHCSVHRLLETLLDAEARSDEPLDLPAPDGDVCVLLNGFVLESTAPGGFDSGWHLSAFGVHLGTPERVGDRLRVPLTCRIRPARSPDLITDPSVLGRWPADQPTSYRLHLDVVVMSAPDLLCTPRTFASGAADVVDFADTEAKATDALTRRNRTIAGAPGYGFAAPALQGFEFDIEDVRGDRDGRFLRAFAARIQQFDYDPERGEGHLVPLLRFSNRGLVPLPWTGVMRLHTAMVQLPEGAASVHVIRAESQPTGGRQEVRSPVLEAPAFVEGARPAWRLQDLPEHVVEAAGRGGDLLSDLWPG